MTGSHTEISASQPAADAVGCYGSAFWRYVTPFLAIIAFLKGFRAPNIWSFTQAQFNYGVGLTRRGFFGWLLSPVKLNLYSHFAIVSALLLLLLFLSLTKLVSKSGILRLAPPELVAVYASSYSVSYLAHLNGYFDIPLAILSLVPLFFRKITARIIAAVVSSCVGILMHEQFLLAFLPVLVAAVLMGAVNRESRRQSVLGALVLVCVSCGLTVTLARYGSLPEARAQLLESTAQSTADRPLSHEVFKIAPRSSAENFAIMRAVWARPTFLPAQIESCLLFGPTAVMLLWGTLLLLRTWEPHRYRLMYASILIGSLAPLSLNLLGWDKNRWNELVCFDAFVLLIFTAGVLGRSPVQFPAKFRQLCLIVMLINMATGGGMLDNRHVRPWPFLRNPDAHSRLEARPENTTGRRIDRGERLQITGSFVVS